MIPSAFSCAPSQFYKSVYLRCFFYLIYCSGYLQPFRNLLQKFLCARPRFKLALQFLRPYNFNFIFRPYTVISPGSFGTLARPRLVKLQSPAPPLKRCINNEELRRTINTSGNNSGNVIYCKWTARSTVARQQYGDEIRLFAALNCSFIKQRQLWNGLKRPHVFTEFYTHVNNCGYTYHIDTFHTPNSSICLLTLVTPPQMWPQLKLKLFLSTNSLHADSFICHIKFARTKHFVLRHIEILIILKH